MSLSHHAESATISAKVDEILVNEAGMEDERFKTPEDQEAPAVGCEFNEELL